MTAQEWVLFRAAEEIADTITGADFGGRIVYRDGDGTVKVWDERDYVDSVVVQQPIFTRVMDRRGCSSKRAFEIARVAESILLERDELDVSDEEEKWRKKVVWLDNDSWGDTR